MFLSPFFDPPKPESFTDLRVCVFQLNSSVCGCGQQNWLASCSPLPHRYTATKHFSFFHSLSHFVSTLDWSNLRALSFVHILGSASFLLLSNFIKRCYKLFPTWFYSLIDLDFYVVSVPRPCQPERQSSFWCNWTFHFDVIVCKVIYIHIYTWLYCRKQKQLLKWFFLCSAHLFLFILLFSLLKPV